MISKVVYPEYDDAGEEEEIFQSEDSQVLIFMALMGNMIMGRVLMISFALNRMLVQRGFR